MAIVIVDVTVLFCWCLTMFNFSQTEMLLLEILGGQEEVRETQKLHLAMLHNIQQQIDMTQGIMEEHIEINLPL